MRHVSNVKLQRFINELKRDFLNKYFAYAIVSSLVMFLFVFLGNPRVGRFPIHWVPEIVASYFLGFWLNDRGMSMKYLLYIYIATVFLTPFSISIDLSHYLLVLPFPLLLASPMFIGYWTAKKRLTKNENCYT